ncbi:hypothetical protein KAFR_0B01940 [Kazachstania africana CBS 2517]|uniref:Rad21/Rec8-like protein N-terminal domain-containing protein n=1 Tax=Kazachstania africana (strain ATCC 22294 / BCRC 22015 / CBS 2517 / CECT 1963 / NBRC 1671 / NRRL Y-8276) TaxID=1071382 RepID=H2AQ42_KAZAF|nr:hypothetical protein KAFR_0B01940 [Kazachstania africana CBS 2517]CCF56492.1 hypothetical protein KAFR_0B01940 [Kazachstania africana CBS 2517]
MVSLPQASLLNNHDSLSSNVTIVWLLASLGSGTSRRGTSSVAIETKNVKKKDILDICIPETCQLIESNESNLPLRHVSNLLYGVAVCYNRKAEYVLSDLTNLLSLVQRNIHYTIIGNGKSTTTQSAKQKSQGPQVVTKNIFLNDDPNFDISYIGNFEEYLDENLQALHVEPESEAIKRQDYINEVSNSNKYEYATNTTSFETHFNRPSTLDELPIDMDFNLELEDIISHQGTIMRTHTSSHTGSNDLDFDYQEKDISLNMSEDVINRSESVNFALGLPGSNDARKQDAHISFKKRAGSPLDKEYNKKAKRNGHLLHIPPKLIKFDGKISLSTDVLKRNHEHYLDFMSVLNQKVRAEKNGTSARYNTNAFDYQPELLFETWRSLLHDVPHEILSLPFGVSEEFVQTKTQLPDTFTMSRMNSTRSEEQGRKQSKIGYNSGSFLDSESNRSLYEIDVRESNDMILNLGQINEDLEEQTYLHEAGRHEVFSEHSNKEQLEESSQDFLNLNFNLPPSSLGRSTSRSSTWRKRKEEDTIDILEASTKRRTALENKEKSDSGSLIQTISVHEKNNNSLQPILDNPTRKFYDYLKEKSYFIGKATYSSPPFKKKLLFEDVVPSTITDAEATVSKSIAASAFFTLLDLASKDLISVRFFQDNIGDETESFLIRNSDDIIIYV